MSEVWTPWRCGIAGWSLLSSSQGGTSGESPKSWGPPVGGRWGRGEPRGLAGRTGLCQVMAQCLPFFIYPPLQGLSS